MKSYYQQRKGGFKLHQRVYEKTIKDIQLYYLCQSKINLLEEKSDLKITQNDVDNAVISAKYKNAIDVALEKYVIKEYRDAVFEHIVNRTEYSVLEEIYYLSTPSMKKWVQRFVYGVAKELGEDFE